VFPGGPPELAYRADLSGRIALITSPALLAELGRILSDEFGWHDQMVEAAVGQVARIGTVVRPRASVSVIDEDPADDRVLEAAREGMLTSSCRVTVTSSGSVHGSRSASSA
jgi:hypothetical protein